MIDSSKNYNELKSKAVNLRLKGLSYQEIKSRISVSKSTLSLWLREIHLTPDQKHKLLDRTAKARSMGSKALKRYRLERTRKIKNKARGEVKYISKRDLWLIGTTLYWAEGHKQKVHNPSQRVSFSNSDPQMLKIFLRWLRECLYVSDDKLTPDIYIHETYQKKNKDLIKYWSVVTGFEEAVFTHIYIKKNKVHSYRKNRGKDYHGVLRIAVRKSANLNRRISGWVEGICLQAGINVA